MYLQFRYHDIRYDLLSEQTFNESISHSFKVLVFLRTESDQFLGLVFQAYDHKSIQVMSFIRHIEVKLGYCWFLSIMYVCMYDSIPP